MCRSSGFGACLPAPSSPRAPSRLPYRCGPRVVGSFRPDDPARLGSARQRRCALGGGADALAARAQRAAPGSARAGGGCYARNVRVSGSPSGSKRTTNNLLARRPPPPPPVCSSRPPAFLQGGGAERLARGRPLSGHPGRPRFLLDTLRPSPSCSRLPPPASRLPPRFAFRAAGDELINPTQPITVPNSILPFLSPLHPGRHRGMYISCP